MQVEVSVTVIGGMQTLDAHPQPLRQHPPPSCVPHSKKSAGHVGVGRVEEVEIESLVKVGAGAFVNVVPGEFALSELLLPAVTVTGLAVLVDTTTVGSADLVTVSKTVLIITVLETIWRLTCRARWRSAICGASRAAPTESTDSASSPKTNALYIAL